MCGVTIRDVDRKTNVELRNMSWFDQAMRKDETEACDPELETFGGPTKTWREVGGTCGNAVTSGACNYRTINN